MYKAKQFLSKRALLDLYYTYIYPYMTYCIIIIIIIYLYSFKTWHEYCYKQCYTNNLHTLSLPKTTNKNRHQNDIHLKT